MSERGLNALAQGGGGFNQYVMYRPKEFGKLFFGPVENVLREKAAAGAEFDYGDFFWCAEGAPHFFELACHQTSKYGVHVARGVEVAGLAELFGVAGVVAVVGIVEAAFHVAREREGTALADFLFDLLAQRGQGMLDHVLLLPDAGRGGRCGD